MTGPPPPWEPPHRQPPATVALSDCLCASADDLGYPLRRVYADRLARHALELLQLAGYDLVRQEER